MTNCTVTTKTPFGQLLISEYNGYITQCRFSQSIASSEFISPALALAIRQLEEYFSGQRNCFDLPLAPEGTQFQQHVWLTLQTIGHGDTWSYRELAQNVGNPKAARAVGTANAKNPICIFIPCHRVIRSNGEPGSYAGGKETKIQLLELEQQTNTSANV